ncbi:MAG: NAD(P)-dependent oxidoreductase [Acetobacteraceae bacterium]
MPALPPAQVPGAGVDGVDFASLPPSAWVCNVFEHEIPIAEFVVLAMLHWATGFDAMRATFTAESWATVYRARVPHREIYGQTLGLIGFGRIGRAIATRARALGMRVVAIDAAAADLAGLADWVRPPASLPDMLAEADYVVVACPLSDATRGLIGVAQLQAMQRSAVLINVSRAEIVAEEPLYEALRDHTIAGAYLDVWYRYPAAGETAVPPARLPFHALPNAICTPPFLGLDHGSVRAPLRLDRAQHHPAPQWRAARERRPRARAGGRLRRTPMNETRSAPAGRDVPIKIVSVKTVVVNAEMRNWVFVKVVTDQDGLYGWGEASPQLEDPRRDRGDRGSGAAAGRAGPARHRAGAAGDEQAQLLPAGDHRRDGDQRHRACAVGHLRQERRPAGLAPARRQGAGPGQGLYASRPRRHALGVRDLRQGRAAGSCARSGGEGLRRAEGRVHPL